jgi:hypothetical protein
VGENTTRMVTLSWPQQEARRILSDRPSRENLVGVGEGILGNRANTAKDRVVFCTMEFEGRAAFGLGVNDGGVAENGA